MIHEEICTYEVCKLAKEKGFPVKEIECWYCEYDGRPTKEIVDEQQHPIITQSLLQRWMREEKGIIVDVVLDWQYNIEAGEIRYQYRIGSVDRMTIEGGIKTKGLVFDKRFTTYELALEDALAYALNNLL